MQDALRVRVCDRAGDGGHRTDQAESRGQGGRAIDRDVERVTFDEPHRVVRLSIAERARRVDRHDRGVLESRRDLDLALEPAPRERIVGTRQLERDPPLELVSKASTTTPMPPDEIVRPSVSPSIAARVFTPVSCATRLKQSVQPSRWFLTVVIRSAVRRSSM